MNVWTAPPHWRAIDFVSDLHLSSDLPLTAQALGDYLSRSRADAICLLGDVFEAWVGDDSRDQPFEADVVSRLRAASATRALFFMVGNRDFLVGPALCADAGLTALPDPTALHAWGGRWVLAHGDAQCLSDQRYQAFRRQVRSSAWQQSFLTQPLPVRIEAARAMRRESRLQQAAVESVGDLDRQACRDLLREADAAVLLHGHTHRPAEHDLGDGLRRIVLSDWDLDDPSVPRAQVLRLHADGRLQRLTPQQACSA